MVRRANVYDHGMNERITDAMIDAELQRQDLLKRSGVVEVDGHVRTNMTFGLLVSAVLVANLATAVLVGIAVWIIAAIAA